MDEENDELSAMRYLIETLVYVNQELNETIQNQRAKEEGASNSS